MDLNVKDKTFIAEKKCHMKSSGSRNKQEFLDLTIKARQIKIHELTY